MKAYFLVPLVFLLGLMLGGWGPRAELREQQEELTKTQALLRQARTGGGASDVGQVTRLLGIEGERPHAAHGASPSPEPRDATLREPAPADAGTAPHAADATPAEPEAPDRPDRPADMEAELNAAMELWELRAEIARSTFLANGDFSDGEAVAFDVLIEAMNLRLSHAIETWVSNVEAKEVRAEDGIRLMNDVTGVLVLTYDEMDRKLPATWRDAAGQSLQLMDFINPSVARPLIRAEGKLNDIGRSFDRQDDRSASPNAGSN